MASFRQLQLEVWQRRVAEQRAAIAAMEERLRLAGADEAGELEDELKKARRVLEWSEEEIRRLTRF